MQQETPTDPATQFIEEMGLISQAENLPRISGRILGLLVVEGSALGLGALSKRLQVSRASVSTNARMLAELGVLRRVAKPGDRQDYYELAPDPYANLLKAAALRMKRAHDTIAAAGKRFPENEAEAKARLAALARFYKAAADNVTTLIEKVSVAP